MKRVSIILQLLILLINFCWGISAIAADDPAVAAGPAAVTVKSVLVDAPNEEQKAEESDGVAQDALFNFKLGLELQETSHLCPWAAEDIKIQNKPLFTVKFQGRDLWKLVIDTNDIEFVTWALSSDDDISLLKACMRSISISIGNLREQFQKKAHDLSQREEELNHKKTQIIQEKTSLNEDIDKQKKKISTIDSNIAINTDEMQQLIIDIELGESTLKELCNPGASPLIKIWQKRLGEQKAKLEELKENERGLERSRSNYVSEVMELHKRHQELDLAEKDNDKIQENMKKEPGIVLKFEDWFSPLQGIFDIDFNGDINIVFDGIAFGKELILPERYKESEFWSPEFSPQATIQHPLKITIPLYFSFFAVGEFSNQNYLKDFVRAIPGLNALRSSSSYDGSADINLLKANLYTPLNGLIFLHALTLSGISNSAQESTETALDKIFEDYKKYKQIDAKMHLLLMSRRSFSSMFRDIKQGDREHEFEDAYIRQILQGNEVFARSGIKRKICYLNYGEQIFDSAGFPRDLRKMLSPLLEPEFYQQNSGRISRLLERGIVTTGMVRNFKKGFFGDLSPEDIFQTYFSASIQTVDVLSHIRCELEISDSDPEIKVGESGRITFNKQDTLSLTKEDEHDALSPPWLLGSTDSMGKYSRTEEKEGKHEEKYGEAVIEVRRIEHITPYFLEKYLLHGEIEAPLEFFLESLGGFNVKLCKQEPLHANEKDLYFYVKFGKLYCKIKQDEPTEIPDEVITKDPALIALKAAIVSEEQDIDKENKRTVLKFMILNKYVEIKPSFLKRPEYFEAHSLVLYGFLKGFARKLETDPSCLTTTLTEIFAASNTYIS